MFKAETFKVSHSDFCATQNLRSRDSSGTFVLLRRLLEKQLEEFLKESLENFMQLLEETPKEIFGKITYTKFGRRSLVKFLKES